MAQGKFIVLYGINNLGKSTQAEKLVEALKNQGFEAEYFKYPVYDLEPFGPMINEYLREGNPFELNPREFQLVHLANKMNFENSIKEKLAKGIHVIAEDYKGTSIAWGMGAGVDESFLKKVNEVLMPEDLVFLFDGERFMESVEKGHKHEENSELMDKVRQAHLKLGQERGWHLINANQTIEEIHQQIIDKVKPLLEAKDSSTFPASMLG